MAVTLSDLLTAQDEDDVLALLVAEAQTQGLQTTDWIEGSPELTIMEMVAQVVSDLVASLMPTIIGGGFVETATGGWLTLNAYQRYNLTRTPAVATVGTETLTCAGTAGPYTIVAGQLRFAYDSDPSYIYTNTTGGVLASGGTLDVTIEAESPGADYNVGADTITTMLTPLPGVTATNGADPVSAVTLSGTSQGTVTPSISGSPTDGVYVAKITLGGQRGTAEFKLSTNGGSTYPNPAIVTAAANVNVDGSGIDLAWANHASVSPSFIVDNTFTFTIPGTWYTTAGADEESDADLQDRCRARWPDLGDVPTEDVYEAWAKASDTSIRQAVASASPSTAATVTVYVAGQNATVSAATAAAAKTYIEARAPLSDIVNVSAATATACTLAGTITVKLADATVAAAQAAVKAALVAYFEANSRIGDGSTVTIRYAELFGAIVTSTGVVDLTSFTLNGGTANITPPAGTIRTIAEASIVGFFTWNTIA